MHQVHKDSICNKALLKVKRKIEYFGDESNLHGVGHVFSMSSIQVSKWLFWLVVLIGCCVGATAILRGALGLHSGNLISYSAETNYLTFDTPFPAVTLCEQITTKFQSDLVKKGIPSGLTAFLKENAFHNMAYCKSCQSCKFNQTCVEDFQPLLDRIRVNCTGLLTECSWGGNKFPCCERFLPIVSEYGTCFVFNSRLTENGDSPIMSVSQEVGLPSLLFTAVQSVQVRVHAPEDLVSVLMENVIERMSSLPLVTNFEIMFKAEQTVNDASVHALPGGMRGCLFTHERPAHAQLWPFQLYSYNTCLLYCKAMAQISFCNCTHHFMPKIGENPTCNIKGLACLNNFKLPLQFLKCDCPMGCEEISYKVVNVRNVRQNLTPEMIKRGTKGHVKLAQLPTLRVVRRAIRDTLGLVVDVGGVGGVFFGASLLSLFEIIYLLCIRRGP